MMRIFTASLMIMFLQIVPVFAKEVEFVCATLGVENDSSLYITGTYDFDTNRNYTWIGPLRIGSRNNLYSDLKARSFSDYVGTAYTYRETAPELGQFFKLELRNKSSSSIIINHPEGTKRKSIIQIDLKSTGEAPSFIEQYIEADCRFGNPNVPVPETISETKDLFREISLKCPQNNSGILEAVQKSKSGITLRMRYKIINDKAVKYIFEKALPGKAYEIIDVSEITKSNNSDNSAKIKYHIKNSDDYLRDDCRPNSIIWTN